MQCHGEDCPFMEDHSVCVHMLAVEEDVLCMLPHSQRVHTHEEIAVILGISKQAVIQLEQKALAKIKRKISLELGEAGLEVNDLFEGT